MRKASGCVTHCFEASVGQQPTPPIRPRHRRRLVGDAEADTADLWLINTCTVKSPSQSAMDSLLRRGRQQGKALLVAGCVPQVRRVAGGQVGSRERKSGHAWSNNTAPMPAAGRPPRGGAAGPVAAGGDPD